MLPRKSFLVALFVALSFCGAGYGDNGGPDQDPFPGPNAAFWNTNGQRMFFPLLDGNNKFQILITKRYLAFPKAGVLHDVDSNGVGHSHWHFQDDYPAAANQYNTNFTGQANAYWDVVFQSGIQGDMHMFNDANTQKNCFSFVLDVYFGRAPYAYWIDDGNAAPGTPGSQTAAFNADAETFAKANVAAGDVLMYNNGTFNSHGTGVSSINCGPPRAPKYLQWKFNGSGYYAFTSNSFNTPKNVFRDPAPGNPLPAVDWQAGGAGSVNQLYPPDKVWRAHPKGN